MEPSADEIILQIRKENEEAVRLLFSCYEKHFKVLETKMIYSYRLMGYSREDLRTILMKETLDIVKLYEMDRSAFFPFWKRIAMQKMNHLYQKEENESTIESKKVSLDSVFLDYFSEYSKDPLERYILKADYETEIGKTETSFSIECATILRLWSEGEPYEAIAEKTGLSVFRINYLLHKMMSMLKKRE